MVYSIRLDKMHNITIDKVCTYNYPDFHKYYKHYRYIINELLTLSLGYFSLLNSSENRFIRVLIISIS